MNDTITIIVAAVPPTVNHMYITLRNGKKALGPEAELFRAQILAAVLPDRPVVPDGPLAFTMRLTFGDRRKTDLDNRLKAAIDAVALALRFDDSRIERIVAERLRCDPGRPCCALTIAPLEHRLRDIVADSTQINVVAARALKEAMGR